MIAGSCKRGRFGFIGEFLDAMIAAAQPCDFVADCIQVPPSRSNRTLEFLGETKIKVNISDFSIGVDIEAISRFRNLNRKESENFLTKIFTEKEIKYCFSKKEPAQHLAVRFAAKEAVVKAINSLGKEAPILNAINIENNTKGVPFVDLKGYDVKISLSHCADRAIASVIVVKK